MIIGALAGWIAEVIMKSNMGLSRDIVFGILGAVVLNALLLQCLKRRVVAGSGS
ncbi:GlsB/YeaQ/YmgE family stress response membrane protein [Sedimentitalea sp. HM32M-2]|uniref:GlsB/YeaQ/YmgE family stress response membrane protein n=1 Tax=Sedimentitalea sp. HM32M-2 TaxID=3351566 RepID=UPI00362AE8FB